ncbi:uncharacterized protein LOC118199533 [Stegodyphus dumicola]|uniref:uncharacterized protein LOC118199533 n=1 Tax=Stegodyphus dumicola TaxID=202533 RepID=UPI0015ADF1EE|nr:uncharacterized protein LOC118199533 [Stegodyphus dumicola]
MLKGDIIKRGESLPFAICSQLGWIISGNTITDDSNLTNTFTVNNLQLNTNELVERFWSLDSIPEVKRISSEDKKCEEFFKTTHFRDQNGRYVVKLPFKDNPSRLGNSKDLALQRFKSLERNLLRSPDTYDMYKHFMKEYLDLGHMEPVRSSESPSQAYYMPHHAVIKESSSTSKIRVVFNATSKSSSGLSINDILMTGPRIQQELFPVLVKFKSYPVVVTADIMKMFRQILVNEEDRNFQRIFWRDSDPIQEFRLNTVTYGTASAPYLATRALYQLAYDEQNNYPLASKAVLQNFFVDDCLVGAQNTEECKNLVNQLLQMLERGGFLLRKWSSNDLSVLENIPQELRNDSEAMKIQDDSSIKVLGINWNPREDYFNFSVSISGEKL